VLPARPRRPKDKAKVEVGVLIAERWILARLRHHTFFSLAEVNVAVADLLTQLNRHPFKKLPGCRREAWEQMDRPALHPLPTQRYEMAEWKEVGVNVDYHVDVDGHYYSVPHRLIGQRVMARFTRTSVEILHKSQRVATHLRNPKKGGHTTVAEHRPQSHREHLQWTPDRIASWARSIGPNCEAAVRAIIASRPIPEHGFRHCLGVIRLSKRYTRERVDRACERALKLNIVRYHHIENMLKSGRDHLPLYANSAECPVETHDNVRGAEYYQ
jgi:transposase